MTKQAFDKIHDGLVEALSVVNGWSTNITEAQTGDYVWLALPCGRVVKSYWRGEPWGFQGISPIGPPIAWQPFIKPIHPFELAKQEESVS